VEFITEYLKVTEDGIVPDTYRRWVALTIIASILNRRVWTNTLPNATKPLYPNLYIMLVGPPGSGKSLALTQGRALLKTQDEITIAPSSVSQESFINFLSKDNEGNARLINSAVIMPSEWGTFMRRPDQDFCAMLADVYDNEEYRHYVLSRDVDLASNLYVNICGACTPAWFTEGFPANSYDQGLPARFIYAYSDPITSWVDAVSSDVSDEVLDDPVTNKFLLYLDKVKKIKGFMTWKQEALDEFNKWGREGMKPVPEDPMLSGYRTRRRLHYSKLGVIIAASRLHKRVELDDFTYARDILLETEINMAQALSSAGGNPYQAREQQIVEFVKFRGEVGEWEVRQRLQKLVPPNFVNTILEELIISKRLFALGDAPGRKLRI